MLPRQRFTRRHAAHAGMMRRDIHTLFCAPLADAAMPPDVYASQRCAITTFARRFAAAPYLMLLIVCRDA